MLTQSLPQSVNLLFYHQPQEQDQWFSPYNESQDKQHCPCLEMAKLEDCTPQFHCHVYLLPFLAQHGCHLGVLTRSIQKQRPIPATSASAAGALLGNTPAPR